MSNTGRRVIVLGFDLAILILIIGLLAVLGFFGLALLSSRA